MPRHPQDDNSPIAGIGNLDRAPAVSAKPCARCKAGRLRPCEIEMAFWQAGGLVVIRGVPAQVCGRCGDQFLTGATALGLDRMRALGLDAAGATARMEVPVLQYRGPNASA